MDYPANKFHSFFPPEFGPYNKITYLGSNYFVSVFDINDNYIFRFANNPDGKESIKKLYYISSELGSKITCVETPKASLYKEFDNFPFNIIIFKKIIGTELLPKFVTKKNMDRLAKHLAEFMHQLHTLDNRKFSTCNLTGYFPDSNILMEIETKTEELLSDYFDEYKMNLMRKIWKELIKQATKDYSTICLVHGDLWFENILFDPINDTLTAILDFENVSLGHPIVDFVSLRYYGKTFFNCILKNYNKLSMNKFLHWSDKEFIVYSFYREINGLYNNLLSDSFDIDSIDKIKVVLDDYKRIINRI